VTEFSVTLARRKFLGVGFGSLHDQCTGCVDDQILHSDAGEDPSGRQASGLLRSEISALWRFRFSPWGPGGFFFGGNWRGDQIGSELGRYLRPERSTLVVDLPLAVHDGL
jgi:hypothetical protein